MGIDFEDWARRILRRTVIVPDTEAARESCAVMQQLMRAAADDPGLVAIAAQHLKDAQEHAVRVLLYGEPAG